MMKKMISNAVAVIAGALVVLAFLGVVAGEQQDTTLAGHGLAASAAPEPRAKPTKAEPRPGQARDCFHISLTAANYTYDNDVTPDPRYKGGLMAYADDADAAADRHAEIYGVDLAGMSTMFASLFLRTGGVFLQSEVYEKHCRVVIKSINLR